MVLWVALAVYLVALAAGVPYALLRGLELRRTVKRVNGTIQAEVDRISAASLRIEHHTARAQAAAGRLRSATDRLGVSRARLDLQLAALREARTQVRRVFWFVPGV